MTTREIADRLMTLCLAGKYAEAITELYAPDVQQYENGERAPGERDALVAACKAWLDSRVLHESEVLGAHVGSESIVLELKYDVTPNATKERIQWSEAAVYRVRGGKISDVRFYYKPPAA